MNYNCVSFPFDSLLVAGRVVDDHFAEKTVEFILGKCHHVSSLYAAYHGKLLAVSNTASDFSTHTCPVYTNSGGVKREVHKNWSIVIPEKAAPVTGTTLMTPGPVPVDSRQ